MTDPTPQPEQPAVPPAPQTAATPPAANPYQQPPAANPYQQAAATPAVPLNEAEDKQWASFAHFGGILGFLPALIIFLIFKDRGARTRVESKEALNWQITWIAASIILNILVTIITSIMWAAASYNSLGVLSVVSLLLGFIGWLPYLANLIFSIMGGIKVNGGGSYRYPFAVRLIK